MSWRCDTVDLIAGAWVVGNRGLGVFAEDIPDEGRDGPPPAWNDLNLPTDAGKEIRFLVTTPPSAGVFFMFEDTSFYFKDAPDGMYYIIGQPYVDGAPYGGSQSIPLMVGDVESSVAMAITTGDAVFAGSAVVSARAMMAINTAAAAFAGSASVSPQVVMAITTEPAVFSGSASVADASPVVTMAITTAPSQFVGSAVVSPRVVMSVATGDAVFSGIAGVSKPAMAITTEPAVFAGSASVGGAAPVVTMSIITEPAVIAGGAVVSPQVAMAISTASAVFAGWAISGDAPPPPELIFHDDALAQGIVAQFGSIGLHRSGEIRILLGRF